MIQSKLQGKSCVELLHHLDDLGIEFFVYDCGARLFVCAPYTQEFGELEYARFFAPEERQRPFFWRVVFIGDQRYTEYDSCIFTLEKEYADDWLIGRAVSPAPAFLRRYSWLSIGCQNP